MSSETELRTAAETAWRQKEWKEAISHYADLLEIVYHVEEDLPLQVCLDLLRYSESLLEANDQAHKDDDLEIAWDCLEHARLSLLKLPPDSVPDTALPDAYEFLATISMKNYNLADAIKQYDAIIEIAKAKPSLSWRIGLNALYMSALALGIQGNGLGRFTQAVQFLEERIASSPEAPDLAAMQEIYNDLVERRAQLPQ
jgi:tetratricopeptide (TPR) repeat protein